MVRQVVWCVLVFVCFVSDGSAGEGKPPRGTRRQPCPVQLMKGDQGYRLARDAQPYFIKGAGGEGSLAMLAAFGANSVRTWSAERLDPVLDQAQRLGMTVTVGIWLGHERHGFNYGDAGQVARQMEDARRVIQRYKDHPAVLLWGIGNEMETPNVDNQAIWTAVNDIARMAKQLDPNHPTMTVIAEVGGNRVPNLNRLCPDIDIVGINSYGGLPTLPQRYKQAGGLKPYIVTEFGPPGMWEVPKTPWGVPLELTSTEKADVYRKGYQQAVASQPGRCLGSYAFNWGTKQEATATWFGMLLPDGTRLGAVDVMTELWSGKPPTNRCPAIRSLKLQGVDQVEPGATVHAILEVTDPDKDPVKVRWVPQSEPSKYGTGGDAEEVPPTFPEAIVKAAVNQVEVRMPADGGGYRLFAYVYDDHGGGATANVPLYVKGPVSTPKARKAELPLVIYDEAGRERPPYVPSGWMGNLQALKFDDACQVRPHAGKTCVRIEYGDKADWAGIVWQHPANDWGDLPGGWNLTGAKELTFWARGERGGEVVSFELGLIKPEKKFPDSAGAKLEKVRLTTEWRPFRIDLGGKDLSQIKSGFAFSLPGAGEPVTFYLDDIRYE